MNSLRINSSMDEFGIANIGENNKKRVLVHIYKDFLDQLITPECSQLEIMFKYIVEYRTIDDLVYLNLEAVKNSYKRVRVSISTFKTALIKIIY